MKPEFRSLRVKQLARFYKAYAEAAKVPRPQKGWIRAVRQAAGITMPEMAKTLGHSSRGIVAYLEKSEAEYSISLGNLREAAEALGCELVYAIVPKKGKEHWDSMPTNSREPRCAMWRCSFLDRETDISSR